MVTQNINNGGFMPKKKRMNTSVYRPGIEDSDRVVRKKVSNILTEFKYLNKKGLEKMIFEAGIPIVVNNLKSVNIP